MGLARLDPPYGYFGFGFGGGGGGGRFGFGFGCVFVFGLLPPAGICDVSFSDWSVWELPEPELPWLF